MEYVIPIVIVVLLVGGFVTFMVLNATKKSSPAADGRSEGAPGIGTDDTPLGDTTQHAGEQDAHGRTIGGQDADEAGGTGRPVQSGAAGTTGAGESETDPDAAAHRARPGEGEGARELEFEPERPASERLSNRDG
jgi:hypothetical protein